MSQHRLKAVVLPKRRPVKEKTPLSAGEMIGMELHKESSTLTFNATIEFSKAVLTAAITMNGGAAVATLAFIGSLVARPALPPIGYAALVDVLCWFGGGIALAALAHGLAFLSQVLFASVYGETWVNPKHPFIEASPLGNAFAWGGRAFQVLTGLTLIGSLAVFVVGGMVFAGFARAAFRVLVVGG